MDRTGLIIEDVKCVNYKDGGINFIMSLKDLYTPNLFNQQIPDENGNNTNNWTPKLKGGKDLKTSIT